MHFFDAQRNTLFRFVGANDRRRNTDGYALGISEKRLHEYVVKHLRLIYGHNAYVGATTIRYLGKAPTKRHRASCRYRNIVGFKRAPLSYSMFRYTHHLQYSASQVRTVAEVSTCFRDEIVFMSCDNKQKVQVGRPANSAYRRPTGYYLESNFPDLDDHSFPVEQKVQLVPMGYMFVNQFSEKKIGRCRHLSISDMPIWLEKRRKRCFSEPAALHHRYRYGKREGQFEGITFRLDDNGRKMIKTERRGHLEVFVTIDRYVKSTSTRHINHLHEIFRKEKMLTMGKKNLSLVADNGPDWKFGPGTMFDLGRLWISLDLDSLVVVHYAPFCSRLNYIERLWPQLTHATKTVTLPITLPGHVLPPSAMTWLKRSERKRKLKQVLVNALHILCAVYE